jgi:hypothetical protein
MFVRDIHLRRVCWRRRAQCLPTPGRSECTQRLRALQPPRSASSGPRHRKERSNDGLLGILSEDNKVIKQGAKMTRRRRGERKQIGEMRTTPRVERASDRAWGNMHHVDGHKRAQPAVSHLPAGGRRTEA